MTPHSRTNYAYRHLVLAAIGISSFGTYAQTIPAQTRGELLYTTHCISCHNAQMHWRSNRQAFDWESLKVQVGFWQGNAGLQWGQADIAEVAGYLNDTIYQYPKTGNRVGLISARTPQKIPDAR